MNPRAKETSGNLQVQQTKPSDYLINYAENQDEANLIRSIEPTQAIGKGGKDTLNSVIDIVARWRWMAGISSNNQDEDEIASELVMISKFIMSNYPELSCHEISLAINLSLTDKLNVDVRTFNVFSPMYVSRILNAYSEYKKRSVHDIISRRVAEENKRQLEDKPSPQVRMDSMIELVKYFYEQYVANEQINDHFSTLYNFFRRIGILNPNKELVNKALEYGKIKASEEQSGDGLMDKMKVGKMNRENVEKRYARNYCVQNLFETAGLEQIIGKIEIKHFQ